MAVKRTGVFQLPGHPHLQKEAQESLLDLQKQIDKACAVLKHYRTTQPGSIYETPLAEAAWLSEADCAVYLKLESEQVTGSFKARGALNRAHAAATSTEAEELVTASTGNHGLGVAHALRLTRGAGVIFLPETAAADKVGRLRGLVASAPVELRFRGTDSAETEAIAAAACREGGGKRVFVSPYNDVHVMAGQGTIADEVVSQLCAVGRGDGRRAVYIAVGGGGLVCGMAARLKQKEPGRWRVVGCQPQASAVLSESVRAGRVLELRSDATLSDGTAGGVEEGSATVALGSVLVDAWAVVDERQIAAAMRTTFRKQGKVIEGAAGVAVAGCIADAQGRREDECATAVVVACGGNVDSSMFARVLCDDMEACGEDKCTR